MSNGLPYYKAYPRDFIEGSIGMNLELKGTYRLVLDLIYMQGGQLPDDANYISGMLGCSIRLWKKNRELLLSSGKIYVENGVISNFRADSELESLAKLQTKQSENRSRPNKNSDLQSPRSNHTEPDTDTDTQTNKKERVSVSEYSDDFESFWKAWVSGGGGGDKAPAFTAWKSLNDADRQLAASLAALWFRAWRKSAPESAKAIHAASYLNQRRFDGFEPPTSSRSISMAGKSVVTNADPLWPSLVDRKRQETGRGVNAESWAFDDAWIEDARSTKPTNEDLDRGRHMQGLLSSVSGNA